MNISYTIIISITEPYRLGDETGILAIKKIQIMKFSFLYNMIYENDPLYIV